MNTHGNRNLDTFMLENIQRQLVSQSKKKETDDENPGKHILTKEHNRTQLGNKVIIFGDFIKLLRVKHR